MGTKVKAKDIKNQAFLTTGTAPDYEITIPRETAYADMDRMEILVNFHDAGSGTITLNINGFGAKTLEGVSSITADEYMTIVFDVSQDQYVVVSGLSTGGGSTGTPRDIAGAVYNSSFDLVSQMASGYGLKLSVLGDKFYICESGTQNLHEYNMTTQFDITTGVWNQSVSLTGLGSYNIRSVTFKPDGLEMYVMDTDHNVHQYTLTTAWDISTASYTGVHNMSITVVDLAFKDDGTKIYLLDPTSSIFESYPLTTAWDITTLSGTADITGYSEDSNMLGFTMKPDGTEVFITGNDTDTIYKYKLTTAWDATTLVVDSNKVVSTETTAPIDVCFKPDGTEMYVLGGGTGFKVYQYDLQSVTPSGGDMLKSVYDTNNSGVVDNSEKVDGKTVVTTLGNNDTTIPTSKAVKDVTDAKIDSTEKGANNGVAPLDASGQVPTANLPSYVDDVLEFANSASLPNPGETGKIYITTNDNKQYRWTGSVYVQIVSGTGNDTDAVHVNVAGEINGITEKTTPVSNDEIIIEDSADSNNKKKVKIGNLPGGTGAVASVNGETGTVVLDTSDIAEVTDKRYMTDAEKTKVSNTSGINTGDQDLSTLALKTNVLEKNNTTTYTPSADYHPATKKYVDDNGGDFGSKVHSLTFSISTTSTQINIYAPNKSLNTVILGFNITSGVQSSDWRFDTRNTSEIIIRRPQDQTACDATVLYYTP